MQWTSKISSLSLLNCSKKTQRSTRSIKRRFTYVLVDEFQDTNKAQYELLKMLGPKDGNIAVVGDDAQSIYSWRGATIENMLFFEKDYRQT